jgi:glycolate oxidase FAD binding subunit
VRVEREPDAIARSWAAVRDVTAFAGRPGDVWRISVRPSAGPAAHAALGAPPAVLDWGGGLVWALLPEGTDARADLAGIAGHATLVRAAPATHARLGTLGPEPAPLARLAADLRARFDPRGLFAPSFAAA